MPGRYNWRVVWSSPSGAIPKRPPVFGSSSAAKMLGESIRGAQNQSTAPSCEMSAVVCRSPIRPCCSIVGRVAIGIPPARRSQVHPPFTRRRRTPSFDMGVAESFRPLNAHRRRPTVRAGRHSTACRTVRSTTASTPVLFIHGLWLHAASWDALGRAVHRARATTPSRPAGPATPTPSRRPGHTRRPRRPRHRRRRRSTTRTSSPTLPAKPILVGHSFGG